jgi:hypothetical protein
MTDAELIESSRAIAFGLMELAVRKGALGDELTALCTNALIEVLGQQLGSPFAVVERLRDLADIVEAQALGKIPSPRA